MNIRVIPLAALFLACTMEPTWAADYGVAPLAEAPPKNLLSKEIVSQIAETGIRVSEGAAPYCDLWLCKSLLAVSGFKATGDVQYPFTPGQLIGVARFARKGSDFREQDIAPGTYTMRYAQQPVDGSHVGTSPTRDFLLLSKAAEDKLPGVMEYKSLAQQSAAAAGASHPALLCLQAVSADSKELPAIRHDETRDWWIAALRGTTSSGGATAPLSIGIVIVGHAEAQ